MHGLYYSVYSKVHKTFKMTLSLVEILFDDMLIYNKLLDTVNSH